MEKRNYANISMNLEGKSAIVTGGSLGIGAAIALKLAECGANVAINYRKHKEEAEEVINQINAMGVKGLLVQADISNYEDAARMIETATNEFGGIDILVNNAGTYCFREDFESIAVKEVEHLLRVNVIAPMVLCQTVIPTMIERGWGRIVNISSVSVSHGGAARTIDYTFSKSALESMTWTLSKSLAPKNVLINAIRVGVTDTKLHQLNSTKNLEDRIRTIPLGRMADPGEIAETIFFLCSDRASFISGTVLEATGGEK